MDFFLNKKIYLNFNVQWRFFLIVNVKWGIAPIAVNGNCECSIFGKK